MATSESFVPRNFPAALVEVVNDVTRRRLAQQILRNLHGVSYPVDVVVATEEDNEKSGDQVGSILRPALRDGQVFYEAL